MVNNYKIYTYQKRYVETGKDKTLFYLRKSDIIEKKD